MYMYNVYVYVYISGSNLFSIASQCTTQSSLITTQFCFIKHLLLINLHKTDVYRYVCMY